ncbi:MAG: MFS transporter [Coriobacteriales bacterium]|jgi:MFS family permease|nr:MFS transporter [Coriobacteriales bacterium]
MKDSKRKAPHAPLSGNMAVLGVIILASFLPPFVGSSLNVSAPSIGLEFHTTVAALSWLVVAFLLCSVSLVLPLGRLGDLTSRRALLITGFIILAITSVIMLFSPSFAFIIFMRVLQGIGGACIFSTSQAILTDAFPPTMRGRVLGLSISAVYAGLAMGPVLGGLLTHYFGWRSVFILIALASVITATVALMKLPPNSHKACTGSLLRLMDLPGCMLYLLATLLLAYGLNRIPEMYAWVLTGLGALLVAAFILYESRTSSPLLKPSLFKNSPNFLTSSIAALLNYGATFAVSFLLSIYLQQVKGFGADISGLVLVTAPLVQSVLSPFAGRLSDKHSPFKLASFGMAVCGIALVSFAFISETSPIWHIFANLVLIGVGFALFSSPNMNAIMSGVPRPDYGIAVSFVATMRNLGQLTSMAAIAVVMGLTIGEASVAETSAPQIVLILRISFGVFILLSIIGIFTSLKRK